MALSGLTSLALTRHRFAEALVFARRARALAPTEPRTLGAIGDALVELGRYREGFATFDRLGQVKPGLPAYSRVSYARELLGDHAGAVAAMQLAADTAVPGSEAAAWTAVHLGKLFASGGDHKSAERQYRIGLGHVPAMQPLSTASHSSRPLGSGCPGPSSSSAARWRRQGSRSTSRRSEISAASGPP